MPDNVPTTTELAATADAATKTAQALDALSISSAQSGDSLNNLGEFTSNTKNAFNAFNTTLSAYGVSLNNSMALTEKQTTQFGLLSAAVLGARTSFNTLHNIDVGGLNTFVDQIGYLTETFTDAKSGIGQLVNFAQQAFGRMVPQTIISQGLSAVKNFVINLAQSADNALRLQNAYIQLSARTGNLSEVYAAAGPNLENLNTLLEKQTALVANAIKTTGLGPEGVQSYYAQLGTIPKALEATVTSSDSASETISLLTASIKIASGTGRNYVDIIEDMKVAFKDYNLTGEEALKFTSRMTEISNKFGTNLDVVRDSLRGTAGVFKMFGNEAEASSRILNNYVGALQSTGLSGDAAVEVVTDMTRAIGNLGIAQKAFLSAQTGGPGGLMGAFQIEKMMREGKIDEVFEKVRTQMQKQFGQIVTLDDASSNPAAAAQMTKQMMILRQGPLGQFAKSDQEAIRILEGFKNRQERKTVTDLSSRIVQDNMSKGTLLQEKSYTELSRIRGILEGARGVAGGATAQDYARDIKTRAPIADAGKRAASSITEFYKLFGDIPESMKAPLDALTQAMESGKIINKSTELQLKEDVEKIKTDSKKLPGDYASSRSVGAAVSRATNISSLQRINLAPSNSFVTPSNGNNLEKLGDINVHVTGYCIKCKQEIEGGQQAAAVNPAGVRNY